MLVGFTQPFNLSCLSGRSRIFPRNVRYRHSESGDQSTDLFLDLGYRIDNLLQAVIINHGFELSLHHPGSPLLRPPLPFPRAALSFERKPCLSCLSLGSDSLRLKSPRPLPSMSPRIPKPPWPVPGLSKGFPRFSHEPVFGKKAIPESRPVGFCVLSNPSYGMTPLATPITAMNRNRCHGPRRNLTVREPLSFKLPLRIFVEALA